MATTAKIRISEALRENDGKVPNDLRDSLPEAPTLLDWILHCVSNAALGKIHVTPRGITREPEPTPDILARASLVRKLQDARSGDGVVELGKDEEDMIDKCVCAAVSPRYAIAIINAIKDGQTVEH